MSLVMYRGSRIALLVGVIGCSSSKPSTTVDAPGTPGMDAPPPPADAAIDALPGRACPHELTEITRITTAAGNTPYDLLAFLPGNIDGSGAQGVVLVERAPDSANARTLIRIRAALRNGGVFTIPTVSNLVLPQEGPEKIVLGDFNGDHLVDVLFSYVTSFPRTSYVYIATQLADHSFVFQPPVDVSACSSSNDERLMGLAVIDVDHDGKDDVVATVSYGGLGAPPLGVTVLSGTSGGVGPARCVASGGVTSGFPAQMIAAEAFRVDDFNGDGAPDIAALYPDRIRVFFNTGASQFTLAPNEVAYNGVTRIQFDHLAGRSHQNLVNVLIADTMTTAIRLRIDGTGIVASDPVPVFPEVIDFFFPEFAVGDFNGDGLTDMIAVGAGGMFGVACDRSVQWDTASGSFPLPVSAIQTFHWEPGRDHLLIQTTFDLVLYHVH